MAPNSHSITSALSENPPKKWLFHGIFDGSSSGYQWISEDLGTPIFRQPWKYEWIFCTINYNHHFQTNPFKGIKKKNVSCGKYPHEIPWKSHHVCCLKISQSMFGTWIWSRHRQPLAEHRRPTRDLPPALGELQKAYTWVIINEICVGQLQKIMTCIITIRQL